MANTCLTVQPTLRTTALLLQTLRALSPRHVPSPLGFHKSRSLIAPEQFRATVRCCSKKNDLPTSRHLSSPKKSHNLYDFLLQATGSGPLAWIWPLGRNITVLESTGESSRRLYQRIASILIVAALSNQLAPRSGDTYEDVPQQLAGGGEKVHRIQRPKSAKAEACTGKCVGTCIRGGAGAPGEGPLNVRRTDGKYETAEDD